jgi:hypothetical protein
LVFFHGTPLDFSLTAFEFPSKLDAVGVWEPVANDGFALSFRQSPVSFFSPRAAWRQENSCRKPDNPAPTLLPCFFPDNPNSEILLPWILRITHFEN